MTLSKHFPSISGKIVATTGAAKDYMSGAEIPSTQLRCAWCPLCLMEDRVGGLDHYLRLEWLIAVNTMCHVHGRPLIERCQKCYQFLNKPDYAMYGKNMALVCPSCFTPIDACLGYDFVTNQHALENILGLLNILLAADRPNNFRPVDLLNSRYFTSPRNWV